MSDEKEFTVFPAMTTEKFIEFVLRAQEEFNKEKTLTSDFADKEDGVEMSLDQLADAIAKKVKNAD